jgi:hypothetical protein
MSDPVFTVELEHGNGVVYCGSVVMFTAALPSVLLEHEFNNDEVRAQMIEYTRTAFGEFLHRRWITPGESRE